MHVSILNSPTPAQRLARERFEYNITRLRTETHRGTSRESLDVLVRLCETLLESAGDAPIVGQYRLELARARFAVAGEGRVRR